jgi:hypothetical protein
MFLYLYLKEIAMLTISKIVGVTFCSFLLCVGLTNAAQAGKSGSTEDDLKAEQSDRRQGGQEAGEKQITDTMKTDASHGSKTIEGKVIRIDGDKYIIKGQDEKEVDLQIDQTTKMSERTLNQGDLIEARLDDQNRVLSIRSVDRRNDHVLESDQEGAHSNIEK